MAELMVVRTCSRCDSAFEARASQLKSRGRFFCSRDCSNKARMRSKLERLADVSMPEPNSGCLLFLGALNKHGCGNFRDGRKTRGAHCVAYEEECGPVPEGHELDHLCRNRACINYCHLEAVPPVVNTLRGQSFAAENARKTTCPQGHTYDETNTYRRPATSGTGRSCRTCQRETVRRYAERRRLGTAG